MSSRTLGQRVVSSAAALTVAAATLPTLGGCALQKAYTDMATSPDDPCAGAIIPPYSPYNLAMARDAAGLEFRQVTPRYNPYVRDVHIGYQNSKPAQAVYVIPTVNGINNIVIINNQQTNSGKLAGFFVGAAIAGIGGGSVASVFYGLGGGIAAAEAGKQMVDDPLNQYYAKRVNACFRKVAEGNYDYAVSGKTGQVVARCREVPVGTVPPAMRDNQYLNYQGPAYVEPCAPGVKGMMDSGFNPK